MSVSVSVSASMLVPSLVPKHYIGDGERGSCYYSVHTKVRYHKMMISMILTRDMAFHVLSSYFLVLSSYIAAGVSTCK